MRVIKHQLTQVMRRAALVARAKEREIAGVLVSHGGLVGLVELPNISRRRGHFELRRDDIRARRAAARQLDSLVVGTWHSHVVGLAEPGPGDIAGAIDGELMLILDTIAREAGLWRIRKQRAYRINFTTV